MMALVTDMGEPLGSHVGNALEVKEAIDVLSGRVEGPLLDVSLELGARLLMLGGAAQNAEDAKGLLMDALQSGRGLDTLRRMIAAQGGDPSCCDDVSRLPQAAVVLPVPSPSKGFVHHMDTIGLGNAAQAMGAGRKTKEDLIDPSVGLSFTSVLAIRLHLVKTSQPSMQRIFPVPRLRLTPFSVVSPLQMSRSLHAS